MSRVRLGYFAAFKSRDTLLMESDAAGLVKLAALLREIAAGERGSLDLHDLPLFVVHGAVRVTTARTEQDCGTRRINPGTSFAWERSAPGWHLAADMLGSLAEPGGPCHQYLDADADEVVVQVSKGEYGDAWWLARA